MIDPVEDMDMSSDAGQDLRGNLFTGCNMFRKDGINLRTSRALVSRLSIYTVHWS